MIRLKNYLDRTKVLIYTQDCNRTEVHKQVIGISVTQRAGLKSTLKEMPSIALDKTTHRVYTNAWRQEMAYGTRYRDSAGFRWILYKCSNKVYKNSRILRMAARRIIYTRWY